MGSVVRSRVLNDVMTSACVVVLAGCDAVISLDPVIADSDAVRAPELLGDWTSNDTVIYRVTADPADSAAYVVRITGPALLEEPNLADVSYSLRATRIRERLLVGATPSDGDSLMSRAVAAYGNIVRAGYVYGVVVPVRDSVRVFPLQVAAVREVLGAKACPSASGHVLLRSSGAVDRDVILGGSATELRSIVSCFLDQPGVLTGFEVLHHPRPPSRVLRPAGYTANPRAR
jgi:hypothetical protein